MTEELKILLSTAAFLGFTHTISGPDHYIPFIVLSKSRNWSVVKTTWLTFICGLGHIGSTLILSLITLALGIGLKKMTVYEELRGDTAAWLLVSFGIGYVLWSLYQLGKKNHHHHTMINDRIDKKRNKVFTPWVLFVIFFLGPCEPLLFTLIYPAASMNINGIFLIITVFSLVTLVTMLITVLSITYGLTKLNFGKYEKYSHLIAGIAITTSGLSILFLGL